MQYKLTVTTPEQQSDSDEVGSTITPVTIRTYEAVTPLGNGVDKIVITGAEGDNTFDIEIS